MITELLSSFWVRPLGITLLHSLWQSLIILLLVYGAIWLFRIQRADVKYNIGLVGLLFFSMAVVVTFLSVWGGYTTGDAEFNTLYLSFEAEGSFSQNSPLSKIFNSYLPVFVTVWLIGVGALSVRLLGGLIYLQRLKNKAANSLDACWSERIQVLKNRLGIIQLVKIKISDHVEMPLVMGAFRPIIFLPVMLFSNLSEEQIETIIAHELAHIKRHDFLINIYQHIIEILFFFNPFVWVLSGLLRKERENACDDLALSAGGDSIAYARALAQLENTRLQPQLAVYLANNKNNLLHRIKRLTGMKTQKFIEVRVLTLVVLAVALMSFGWYSLRKEDVKAEDGIMPERTKNDYSLVTTTTDTTDNFVVSATVPASAHTKVPFMPKKNAYGAFNLDTVPPPPPLPAWDEAFTKKFKEHFDEFYSENQEEFEKMMEELMDENMEMKDVHAMLNRTRQRALSEENMALAREQLRATEEQLRVQMEQIRLQTREHMKLQDEQLRIQMEKEKQQMSEQLRLQQEQMRTVESKLREQNVELRKMEESFKKFQDELVKELVSDGYLDDEESVKNLHFKDGDMEVNGKKIKDKDARKYEKIYQKHFGKKPGDFTISH